MHFFAHFNISGSNSGIISVTWIDIILFALPRPEPFFKKNRQIYFYAAANVAYCAAGAAANAAYYAANAAALADKAADIDLIKIAERAVYENK